MDIGAIVVGSVLKGLTYAKGRHRSIGDEVVMLLGKHEKRLHTPDADGFEFLHPSDDALQITTVALFLRRG